MDLRRFAPTERPSIVPLQPEDGRRSAEGNTGRVALHITAKAEVGAQGPAPLEVEQQELAPRLDLLDQSRPRGRGLNGRSQSHLDKSAPD
jgi:hypothetical protein